MDEQEIFHVVFSFSPQPFETLSFSSSAFTHEKRHRYVTQHRPNNEHVMNIYLLHTMNIN